MSSERLISTLPPSLWLLAVGYFPSPHFGLTLRLTLMGSDSKSQLPLLDTLNIV